MQRKKGGKKARTVNSPSWMFQSQLKRVPYISKRMSSISEKYGWDDKNLITTRVTSVIQYCCWRKQGNIIQEKKRKKKRDAHLWRTIGRAIHQAYWLQQRQKKDDFKIFSSFQHIFFFFAWLFSRAPCYFCYLLSFLFPIYQYKWRRQPIGIRQAGGMCVVTNKAMMKSCSTWVTLFSCAQNICVTVWCSASDSHAILIRDKNQCLCGVRIWNLLDIEDFPTSRKLRMVRYFIWYIQMKFHRLVFRR